MGPAVSVLRHRRLLTGIVEQIHATVADLEQAVGIDPSPPLVRLIDPARGFMLLAEEALREHQEIHDVSTKRTPLRPPSSSCLAAVSGISDRVGAILDAGKTNT